MSKDITTLLAAILQMGSNILKAAEGVVPTVFSTLPEGTLGMRGAPGLSIAALRTAIACEKFNPKEYQAYLTFLVVLDNEVNAWGGGNPYRREVTTDSYSPKGAALIRSHWAKVRKNYNAGVPGYLPYDVIFKDMSKDVFGPDGQLSLESDSVKFRGWGPIQITGKATSIAVARRLQLNYPGQVSRLNKTDEAARLLAALATGEKLSTLQMDKIASSPWSLRAAKAYLDIAANSGPNGWLVMGPTEILKSVGYRNNPKNNATGLTTMTRRIIMLDTYVALRMKELGHTKTTKLDLDDTGIYNEVVKLPKKVAKATMAQMTPGTVSMPTSASGATPSLLAKAKRLGDSLLRAGASKYEQEAAAAKEKGKLRLIN